MTIQRSLISIVVAAGVLAAQTNQTPAAALGAARHLEEAEGKYPAAIEAYKSIVLHAGKDRALAAQALVRMGQCYEKLGDTEARKTYERIIREFNDRKDAVTIARARLAVLATRQAETGIVAQQVGPHLGDKQYGTAISSDGRYIAAEYHGRISVQDLRTLEEHNVIGVFNSSKEAFRNPFISPDGKQVACLRWPTVGQSDLWIVGADGSNPRLVAKSVSGLFGWSPDGKRLLASAREDGEKLQTVLLSVADGSSKTIPGLTAVLRRPRLSPDGRFIAFYKFGTAGAPPGIYTLPVEGGAPILMADNAVATFFSSGQEAPATAWTPDGNRLLFVRDFQGSRDLWSIPVVNGAPAGPAQMVKDKIESVLDVTAAGDIYYQVGILTRDVNLAGVDPQTTRLTSQPKPLTSGEQTGGAAWSPDGQYLAYYVWRGPQRAFTVVIRSAGTGEERTLTPKDPLNEPYWAGALVPLSMQPLWCADSRSLFIHAQFGRVGQLDIQTGELKRLWDDKSFLPVNRDGAANSMYNTSVAVAPDGRNIYQLERDPAAQQTKIMRVDLQTKARSEIYRMDAEWVVGLALSPDGSRLLMTRIRLTPGGSVRGTRSIVILPVTGGAPTEFASPPNLWMDGPAWSSDGRRLLFSGSKSSGEIYSMPVEGGSPLLMGTGVGLSSVCFLHASPDGTQIVFTDEHWNNHLWVLKNAFNTLTTGR